MHIQTAYKQPLIAASDVSGIEIPLSNEPFFTFEKFQLFNNNNFYRDWLTDNIVDQFGLIRLSKYNNKPHFLSIMEKTEAFKYYNTVNTVNHCNILSNHLQAFTFYLWFIKDNAVNSGCLLMEDQSEKIASGEWRYSTEDRLQRFSKATGIYEPTAFSVDELTQAEKILNAARQLIPNHQIDKNKIVVGENPIAQKNPLHDVDYNSFTRIERSIMFLTHARSSSFLPFKIAFYMGVYECLFSTDKVEIAHKVAERASFYLGGTSTEKQSNYKLIKDAYNLRSNYIHGGTLDEKALKTYKGIENICLFVDSMTRNILTRVILKDSKLFLLPKNELEEWYSQLLFS